MRTLFRVRTQEKSWCRVLPLGETLSAQLTKGNMDNTDIIYIATDGSFGDANGMIIARASDFDGESEEGIDLLEFAAEHENNIYRWAHRTLNKSSEKGVLATGCVEAPIKLMGLGKLQSLQKNIYGLLRGWDEVASENKAINKKSRKEAAERVKAGGR